MRPDFFFNICVTVTNPISPSLFKSYPDRYDFASKVTQIKWYICIEHSQPTGIVTDKTTRVQKEAKFGCFPANGCIRLALIKLSGFPKL